MDCDKLKDLISLYIDDELDENEKKLVEDHINNCEDCRKYLEEYKKIRKVLHEMPEEEPPKGYCDRLHAKLMKEKKANKSKFMFKWIKYGSIAAALVIVIFAVYMAPNLRMGSSKSQNSVAYDSAMTEQATADMDYNGFGASGAQSKMAEGNMIADLKYKADDSVAEIQDTREMKIIKTGSIAADTENFDLFMDDLNKKIEFFGGFVEQNNTSVYQVYEDKKLKYSNLVIRVPDEKFYEFISYLEESCDVNQKNISESDVTKQYYEKDNQVKNLEAQEQHLRELYDKAATVEEMLLIESELNRVRTQIDALNISLSDIDDRSSMATINLQVQEVLPTNFSISNKDSLWERAKDGFINTVNGLIQAGEDIVILIVSLAPILIILVILLIIILVKVKKYRKKL